MIQCIGSRNEEHPYCSRICCTEAIKNSIPLYLKLIKMKTRNNNDANIKRTEDILWNLKDITVM